MDVLLGLLTILPRNGLVGLHGSLLNEEDIVSANTEVGIATEAGESRFVSFFDHFAAQFVNDYKVVAQRGVLCDLHESTSIVLAAPTTGDQISLLELEPTCI